MIGGLWPWARQKRSKNAMQHQTEKTSIVRTLKAAVKDKHGDVYGYLGIFSDITARKQAEAGTTGE